MHVLTAAILLTSALLARAYECSPDAPSPYYNTTTTADDVSTTPPLTPSSPPSPDTPSTTSVRTFATSFLWPHSPPDDPGTGSPLTPPTRSPSAATPSTTAEPTPLTTFTPSTLAPSLLLPDDPTPSPITVIETMSIRTTVTATVTATVTPTPPLGPLSTQPADSLPEPASLCSDELSATSTPPLSILRPPSPIPPSPAPTLPLPLPQPQPQPQPSQPASQLAATSSFTGTDSSGAAAPMPATATTTATTTTETTPTATGKRIWFLPHFTLDTAGLLPATPTIGPGSGELPVFTSLDTAVEGGMALGANMHADASVASAAVTATALSLSPLSLPLASGPLGPSGHGQPSSAPLATAQKPVSASLRKRSPAPRGVERLGPGTRGTGKRGSGRKRRQACRPCEEEGKVSCRGDVAVGVCEGGCVEVGFLGRGRGNGCEDE